MATLESIQARIAQLQAQAQELVAKQSTVVLDKIRELMTKHGITTAEIEAHVGKRRGRKPGKQATKQATISKHAAGAPKYRDPKTGATWTGHGRAPAWIAAAKDRNKFLISGTPTGAAPTTKKVAKAGNYVRGPQPAMYQDPKTGATWSGRGRAPAWMANARDRTKFLIEKVEAPATPRKAKAEKATPASRTVTKKTAAKKAPARKVATRKATAPARKTASKKSAGAKSPVVRKARVARTVKSAKSIDAAVPQAAPDTATGTPA